MENLEATATVPVTEKSDLSDWAGPNDTMTVQTPNETIRLHTEAMVADHVEYTDRLYDFFTSIESTFPEIGPGGDPMDMFKLLDLILWARPLYAQEDFYQAFVYDSLKVRVTLSDPKNLSGALVVGYYPFVNWFGVPFSEISTKFSQNAMMKQSLMLSPEAQLLSFSSGQDVVFDIPWQMNTPHMTFMQLQHRSDINVEQAPYPGEPILYYNVLAANYVTDVARNATLKVFVSFNGLRFLGPGGQNAEGEESTRSKRVVDLGTRKQSGLAAAAAVGASIVADAAVDVGKEIFSTMTGNSGEVGVTEAGSNGTYEQPTAVQLSYVGDSTSVGPPPCTPIFTDWIRNPVGKHAILQYLKRPQFIGTQTSTGDGVLYYANPVFPTGFLRGPNQQCTYFRWFSQAASYWRGTINFHFVILGHPMVEVQYQTKLNYLPETPSTSNDMGESSILQGVASGVHHITVPMPFLTLFDHLPIIDNLVLASEASTMTSFSPTSVEFAFSIISSMLDIEPTITCAVFMSAGDDFEFMQPYAVGLNTGVPDESNAISKMTVGQLAKKDKKKKSKSNPLISPLSGIPPPPKRASTPIDLGTRKQVGLPPANVTHETKAKAMLSTDTMPALVNVEDFMSIWSRCLPYFSYDDNDEPEPDFATGAVSPCWWPMDGQSASYTLDVNNSWYCTNDFISLYSSQFLYFRGSLALKICCAETDSKYKFVTLMGPGYKNFTNADYYRQLVHNPFTSPEGDLPVESNFGNGTVCTPAAQQPVIDITIPYRSSLTWSLCNPQQYENVYFNDPDHGDVWWNSQGYVRHNILLQDPGADLKDALHRKVGNDYGIAVETLLPPPTLWIAKGYHWES